VQDSGSDGLSEASRHQQAEGSQAEGSVPDQVWKLCGVPVGLQATDLRLASHRLQQLDSVQCPLEVVSCLHHTDEAITEAVGKVRWGFVLSTCLHPCTVCRDANTLDAIQ